jgi:hypothetical protein
MEPEGSLPHSQEPATLSVLLIFELSACDWICIKK